MPVTPIPNKQQQKNKIKMVVEENGKQMKGTWLQRYGQTAALQTRLEVLSLQYSGR